MKNILLVLILLGSLSSCTKSENSPGYQYFDDMYDSPAYKAYDVDCDTHMTCRQTPEGAVEYK